MGALSSANALIVLLIVLGILIATAYIMYRTWQDDKKS